MNNAKAKQNPGKRQAGNGRKLTANQHMAMTRDRQALAAMRKEVALVRKEIALKNTGQPRLAAVQQKQFNQSMGKAARRLNDRSLRFFTVATDPMHDTGVGLCGWPDRNIANSIVRRISQAVPLSMPDNDNIPKDKPWDCYIVLNPWFNRVIFKNFTRVNNVLELTPSTPNYSIGGLQAFGCTTGTDFVYPVNGATDIVDNIADLGLDPDITQGVGRVVGVGIEVINTTAELYKSGTCYAWRAPEPELVPTVYNRQVTTTPFAAVQPFDGMTLRMPPKNPAQALLYNGTTEWEAKEGAYSVATFHDFANPAKVVNYTQPVLVNSFLTEDRTYTDKQPGNVNLTTVLVPQTVVSGTSQTMPGMKIYPIDQMGMILTGLTPQSTFSLKFNVYYESFPSVAEPDLITLARPSTKYDPYVLELLASVMRSLPVAVPSRDNAEGDWWDSVLKAVAIVAPAIATAMGLEIAVPAITTTLSAIRQYRNNN